MPRKKDTITESIKKPAAKVRPASKHVSKQSKIKKEVKVKKNVPNSDLKEKAILIKRRVAKIVDEVEYSKISKEEVSVSLPKNTPIRLLEKKILLQNLFSESVIKSAYKIAYVSSICLILVGATLATLQFFPKDFGRQSAEVIGTTEAGTINSLDPTISSSPALVGKSEFDFVTTVPDYVTEDLPVKFVVTNAENVVTKVTMIGKTGFFDVSTEFLSNSAYRATIPASKLAIGYYELRIYVKPLNGDPATSFASQKFFAGNKEQEDLYKSMQDSSVSTDTNDESNSANVDSTDESDPKSENLNDDTDSDNEPSVVEEDKELVEETEAKVIPPPDNLEFELVSPLSVISNTAIFTTKNAQHFNFLELYLRPSQSLTPRFVTLASKRFDNWQFVFDTKNIPNGEYEFFAKTKKDDKIYISKSMKVKVYNQTALMTTPIKTVLEEEEKPEEVKDEPKVEREFSDFDDEEFSSNDDIVRIDNSKTEAEKILLNNSAEISELLRLYAIAVQAGDPSLIKSIEDSITQKRTKMALTTLNDNDTHYLSDDIEEEMSRSIERLQEKVVAFESLRKEKSGGSTAIDTDSDGISDLDEEKLYKTDPKESDSDGDGVSDGIEIMRGFDPLDEKIESMISFQSPKESAGLVRSDVLVVEEVLPVVKSEQNNTELVSAEIRGKALPNSIVNIYIFSTPIVVTVRTDADGSFVYTFDKELEDGKHDVYVAMTDNTGDIVAQSNAFSFVKQAQAFTPVDAAESQIVTVETPVDSAIGTYNTVIGVAILALGLILLMFGISLRKKSDGVIEENISV